MKKMPISALRLIQAAAVMVLGAFAPSASAIETSEFLQWLLPKPFQSNPDLNLTVVTEVTTEGKKLPPVSPEHPAYFRFHNAGYKQFGDVSSGEKTLLPKEIEALLQRALAANGYLPIKAEGDPFSLVIVYSWGTHNNLFEGDPENPVNSFEQLARNVVDRAALVGGNKLAREVNRMIQENADLTAAANAQLASGGAPTIPYAALNMMNPFNAFRMRSQKNETLLTQLGNDVYYVVASAYSASSVAANQRVMLWRTRMTVGSNGVSQMQTLPVLVQSAAPYFGKETDGGEVLFRKGLREGKVEIGEATVVEREPARPAK